MIGHLTHTVAMVIALAVLAGCHTERPSVDDEDPALDAAIDAWRAAPKDTPQADAEWEKILRMAHEGNCNAAGFLIRGMHSPSTPDSIRQAQRAGAWQCAYRCDVGFQGYCGEQLFMESYPANRPGMLEGAAWMRAAEKVIIARRSSAARRGVYGDLYQRIMSFWDASEAELALIEDRADHLIVVSGCVIED